MDVMYFKILLTHQIDLYSTRMRFLQLRKSIFDLNKGIRVLIN